MNSDNERAKWAWVQEQVAEYESSGGTRANTLRDTGLAIMVMTTTGHKSGQPRKVPLMRVVHEGEYAIVASKGGNAQHPQWYHNLVADPNVQIQDGPEPFAAVVRQVSGEEREVWWERSVAAFPPYAEYREKAGREIPLFVASRL